MVFGIKLVPELWACSLLPEGMIESWILMVLMWRAAMR